MGYAGRPESGSRRGAALTSGRCRSRLALALWIVCLLVAGLGFALGVALVRALPARWSAEVPVRTLAGVERRVGHGLAFPPGARLVEAWYHFSWPEPYLRAEVEVPRDQVAALLRSTPLAGRCRGYAPGRASEFGAAPIPGAWPAPVGRFWGARVMWDDLEDLWVEVDATDRPAATLRLAWRRT